MKHEIGSLPSLDDSIAYNWSVFEKKASGFRFQVTFQVCGTSFVFYDFKKRYWKNCTFLGKLDSQGLPNVASTKHWILGFFHAEEDRQRQRRRKVDHNQKIDSYRRLVANVRAIGILAFWKSICLVNITKSNNVPSWAAAWHYDDVIEYISLLCRSNHCQNTQLHTPILNFTRQICAQ
jgi:hypothetical protein